MERDLTVCWRKKFQKKSLQIKRNQSKPSIVCTAEAHTQIIKFLYLDFGHKLFVCLNLKTFLLKHFFSKQQQISPADYDLHCIATITRQVLKVKNGQFDQNVWQKSKFTFLQLCSKSVVMLVIAYRLLVSTHSQHIVMPTHTYCVFVFRMLIKHSNWNKQALEFFPDYYR